MQRNTKQLCGIGLCVAFASSATAGVIITIEEVGGDVIGTGTGTLDLSAWTYDITANFNTRVIADILVTVGAPGSIDIYRSPVNFAGPANIGPGTAVFFADSGTGDLFGFQFLTTDMAIAVPEGYVSGDQLDGTATWNGQTIASLGLTEGSYTWTWGTPGATADFFTINVIPAPAPGIAIVMGALVMGGRRRRK